MRIAERLPVSSFHHWTAAALVAVALAVPTPSRADGRLEARYAVTMAGITIGQASWSLYISDDQYVSAATGKASGMMSVLVSGEGTVSARGAIRGGQLAPERFTASMKHDDDKSDTRMVLDNGAVKEL